MSDDGVLELDELHVVSDLHLGGATGFQIFNQGPALAWTIRCFAAASDGRRVGLCLNGDIVDFLAEPDATYFDAGGAVERLRRIRSDPAFREVFLALREFVAKPDRLLVLVLGNHDVELSHPAVQEDLVQHLTDGDPAARGRILLRLDGTGFRCRVGGRQVLCVHGNEVDDWNVIDLGDLHRASRSANLGLQPDRWIPCAGTRLVIDVMNEIKRRYPWVDLLKPETELVPAMLLALQPAMAKKIAGLVPVAGRRTVDSIRRRAGFLANAEEAPTVGEQDALELVLARAFTPAVGAATTSTRDPIRAVLALPEDRTPLQVLGARERDAEFLGFWGAIWDRIRGREPIENVRELFQRWLGDDRTFSASKPDSTFEELDALVSPEIDFVVAGHTHLHRALRRVRGRGWYLNTGSWIRLIGLRPEWLAERASFERVWNILKVERAGMDPLEKPTDGGPPLVFHVRSVVSIVRGPDGTTGALRVVDEGQGSGWQFREVLSS